MAFHAVQRGNHRETAFSVTGKHHMNTTGGAIWEVAQWEHGEASGSAGTVALARDGTGIERGIDTRLRKQHGFCEHSFYAWRQKFRAETQPVSFTLVQAKRRVRSAVIA